MQKHGFSFKIIRRRQ